MILYLIQTVDNLEEVQRRRALQMADAVFGPGSNLSRLLMSSSSGTHPVPMPCIEESPHTSSTPTPRDPSARPQTEGTPEGPSGVSSLMHAAGSSEGEHALQVVSALKDVAVSSRGSSHDGLVMATSSSDSSLLSGASCGKQRAAGDSSCGDQDVALESLDVYFVRPPPVDVRPPSRSSPHDATAIPGEHSREPELAINAMLLSNVALLGRSSASGRYAAPSLPRRPPAIRASNSRSSASSSSRSSVTDKGSNSMDATLMHDRLRELVADEPSAFSRAPSFDVMLPMLPLLLFASNAGGGSRLRPSANGRSSSSNGNTPPPSLTAGGPLLPPSLTAGGPHAETPTLLTTAAFLMSAAALSLASGSTVGGRSKVDSPTSGPSLTASIPPERRDVDTSDPDPDPVDPSTRLSIAYGSLLLSPTVPNAAFSRSPLQPLPYVDAEASSGSEDTLPSRKPPFSSTQEQQPHERTTISRDNSLSDSLERLLPPLGDPRPLPRPDDPQPLPQPNHPSPPIRRAKTYSGTTSPHGTGRLRLPSLPGVSKDEQLLLTSLRSMGEAFSSTSSLERRSTSVSPLRGPSRISSFRAASSSLSSIAPGSSSPLEVSLPSGSSSKRVSRLPSREICHLQSSQQLGLSPEREGVHSRVEDLDSGSLSEKRSVQSMMIDREISLPEEVASLQAAHRDIASVPFQPDPRMDAGAHGSVDRVLSAVLERLEVLGSSVDELRGALGSFQPTPSQPLDSDGSQRVVALAPPGKAVPSPLTELDAHPAAVGIPQLEISFTECSPWADDSGTVCMGEIPLLSHAISTDSSSSSAASLGSDVDAAGMSPPNEDPCMTSASGSKARAEDEIRAALAAAEMAVLAKAKMMTEVSETLDRFRAERDATATAAAEAVAMLRAEREATAVATAAAAAMLRSEREAVAESVTDATIRVGRNAAAIVSSAATLVKLKVEEETWAFLNHSSASNNALMLSNGQFSKQLPGSDAPFMITPSRLTTVPTALRQDVVTPPPLRQGPRVDPVVMHPLNSEGRKTLLAMPRLEPRNSAAVRKTPIRRRGEQRRAGEWWQRDHNPSSQTAAAHAVHRDGESERGRQLSPRLVQAGRSLVQGLYIIAAGLMGGSLASASLANAEANKAGMRLD